MWRKTFLLSVVAFFLFVPAANAAPSHWYRSGKWWLGVAVYGAAVAADYGITARNQARGAVETNTLLGPHPSTGLIVGVSLAEFGGLTVAHAVEWHEARPLSKPWRVASYLVIPAIAASANGYGAIHNAQIKLPALKPIGPEPCVGVCR